MVLFLVIFFLVEFLFIWIRGLDCGFRGIEFICGFSFSALFVKSWLSGLFLLGFV